MASTTALTGRNGKVLIGANTIARITQWAVNPTLATSTEWGDSDSAGFTNRAPGRKDATFTAEGKFDSGVRNAFDLFQPGDILLVLLYLVADGSIRYNFPRALCTDFSLTVNVDSEEVIGWSSSWGADGEYSVIS